MLNKKSLMVDENLKDYLDEKAEQYNCIDFIENDPIRIPHQFYLRQDIEITGFLTATISWGNRKSIIKSANKMIDWMGNSPYDFVCNVSYKELNDFTSHKLHRTFNGEDFAEFVKNLKELYTRYSSMESVFLLKQDETNFYHSFERFRSEFLLNPLHRSKKHISSTYKNASAKRLMMFLRWMVRKDNKGVDFGIWENIDASNLSIPLDVHTGNVSRMLGLINRKQNDWKTVEELDRVVRKMDAKDPSKYDYALFGIGVTKELEFK